MTLEWFVKNTAVVLGLILSLIIGPDDCSGFYQPEYQNRGITNFLDAAVPGPGFYYATYLFNFESHDLRVKSESAPGDFEISSTVSMHQFVYISKKKVLGGYCGGEIIQPFITAHLDNNGAREDDQGLGDTFFAVFLQSDEKKISAGNLSLPLYWRFLVGMWGPTGEYDHEKSLNVGNNLYTFESYLSTTIFPLPKWSVSSRLMYHVHTENHNFGPEKDDLRPGDLFNVNVASSYEIIPGVRAGGVMTYWNQTSDDEINGSDIRGRERALSFGPGAVITRFLEKWNACLMVDALFDTHVRNRPEGAIYQARLIVAF